MTPSIPIIYDSAASLAATREDLSSLFASGRQLRFGVIGTGCIGASRPPPGLAAPRARRAASTHPARPSPARAPPRRP